MKDLASSLRESLGTWQVMGRLLGDTSRNHEFPAWESQVETTGYTDLAFPDSLFGA